MESNFARERILLLVLFLLSLVRCAPGSGRATLPAVVLQTDFGVKDGAVAAMKGVIRGVDDAIDVYDLTHEIPAYNTWEAAYRLAQTANYWPKGTVFVSVVDPGVGTDRKSVVLRTKSGHYFVSPDNGTLGLVAEQLGVEAVREIDEAINRRASSHGSYTFHGRDVYAYTAARLASGKISFEQVGNRLADSVVSIRYQRAVLSGDSILGMIPVLDVQFGNIWTNIPDTLTRDLPLAYGDSLVVDIRASGKTYFQGSIPLVRTFGEVLPGRSMAYFNSLMQLSLAINQGSMADTFHIQSGPDWQVVVRRKKGL